MSIQNNKNKYEKLHIIHKPRERWAFQTLSKAATRMVLQVQADPSVLWLVTYIPFRSLRGLVVKLLAFLIRGRGLILGFSSLNRGPMTIFQNKLLTWTDCYEAGDYVVPNVLSPRDLVFRPDILKILLTSFFCCSAYTFIHYQQKHVRCSMD